MKALGIWSSAPMMTRMNGVSSEMPQRQSFDDVRMATCCEMQHTHQRPLCSSEHARTMSRISPVCQELSGTFQPFLCAGRRYTAHHRAQQKRTISRNYRDSQISSKVSRFISPPKSREKIRESLGWPNRDPHPSMCERGPGPGCSRMRWRARGSA